jgi:hypothetical protein
LILGANKDLRDARLAAKSAPNSASSGAADAASKRVHMMENRVEKANRKLGTVLMANAKARAVIENLRQERLVFANIHAKLDKQLTAQKREMALVVERSNQVRGMARRCFVSLFPERHRAHIFLCKLFFPVLFRRHMSNGTTSKRGWWRCRTVQPKKRLSLTMRSRSSTAPSTTTASSRPLWA